MISTCLVTLWAEKSIGMKKARQLFEAKEEYFTRNGAILLEKQITCNKARDKEPIKIFFAKDIQQTTNNYDPKPRKQWGFSHIFWACIEMHQEKGDERPAMREVTLELRRIQHLIWSKQNNETGSVQTPSKSCNWIVIVGIRSPTCMWFPSPFTVY